MHLHTYGSLEPIQFKLMLSGVSVPGYPLADADVILYIDGSLYSVDSGEIGTECSEIGNGWYKWTPINPAQTQGKKLIVDISDSVGSSFDDNALQIFTGGNINAFFGNVPP